MIINIVGLHLSVMVYDIASLLEIPQDGNSADVVLVYLRGYCSGDRVEPAVTLYGSLELVIASLHCYIGVGCTVFAEVDDFRILVESKGNVCDGTSLNHYAFV